MIHEIGVELQAELKAQGCPFPVVDGPEPSSPTTYWRERIVIEHDQNARDAFTPVQSQRTNPKHLATRRIATKLRIFAKASDASATPWEHRRKAEHVLDLVLVALDKVIRDRKNLYTFTGGAFYTPPDLAATEVAAGAAYELTFLVHRGVYAQTFKYAIRPEVGVGSDVAIVPTGSASAPGFSPENF